jgi:prepilin-type N-terminal cleavage/methylation domain-containing protein
MFTNRLHIRTASKRGGFTLVELLVVIGIIAILAGVALGPITNGIKQAKHNAAMQYTRQIGQICFAYATDNSNNNNSYPTGATSEAIANTLLNSNYVNDPSIFLITGVNTTKVPYTPAAGTFALKSTNVSYNFTALTTTAPTGGITSATGDLIPLVYFSDSSTDLTYPLTAGKAYTVTLDPKKSPFGGDGIAVFYKGNNAVYIKAGTTTQYVVDNFVSANNQDTATYTVVVP